MIDDDILILRLGWATLDPPTTVPKQKQVKLMLTF